MNRRYKLYLASGIRLWNLYFKDQYSPYFNNKLDLFEPALIDNQYANNHRLISIKIATKDLSEINKCDAVLAYMKMYDTQDNGPAGTDSSWECGYAIGSEKPTIMLVEDLAHLDYYASQWMVTFSIGAILTTDAAVAEAAKKSDKFTHTHIIYCAKKEEFEDRIAAYLDSYYRSIYSREGLINFYVDEQLRSYSQPEKILQAVSPTPNFLESGPDFADQINKKFDRVFNRQRNFDNPRDYKLICGLEKHRAKFIKNIIADNYDLLPKFLDFYIQKCVESFERNPSIEQIAGMIEYWLAIPARKVKGHKQGLKKTRPTIFYELYDLVSHHIVQSQKYFSNGFTYRIGAIIEIYNWLNTYAIDDVFDNSTTRQGHATLHVKFKSRKNALLLGAIGHCLALKLLYRETKENMAIGKELIKSLNEVQLVMYQGQLLDLDLTIDNKKQLKSFIQNNDLHSALDIYFMRIYGICGFFYEQIGRMAMQSTNVGAQFYHQEEVESTCVSIAKLFGLVQMIRNDLGDYIFPESHSKLAKGMKSSSHNDIAEGKLTLPLIYAVFNHRVSKTDRHLLLGFVGKKNLSKREKMKISRIIWESGAIEFCMQFVEEFSKLVREQYINYIHETPTRLKWIIKLMDITPLINRTFKELALSRGWKKLEPMPVGASKINKIIQIKF